MKWLTILSAGAAFLGGCGGDSCGDLSGIEYPYYASVQALWATHANSTRTAVANANPLQDSVLLSTDASPEAADVALVFGGDLEWQTNAGAARDALSHSPAKPILNWSLLPRAHACTLAPPSIQNPLKQIEITIATEQGFVLPAGADANWLFRVEASHKGLPGDDLTLAQWNQYGAQFHPWIDYGAEQASSVMLVFSNPGDIAASSVVFAITATLDDDSEYRFTTEPIVFSNDGG